MPYTEIDGNMVWYPSNYIKYINRDKEKVMFPAWILSMLIGSGFCSAPDYCDIHQLGEKNRYYVETFAKEPHSLIGSTERLNLYDSYFIVEHKLQTD